MASNRTEKRKPAATNWIDISVPIRGRMVHWPGDAPVSIERTHSIQRGDENNLSQISMSCHTGTHMDAPLHFFRSGVGLDQMPLDTAVGPARVIQIRDPRRITAKELLPYRIRRGERVIFKTRNSDRCWKRHSFVKDFVALSAECADFLAQTGVRVAGVDYLSVGPFHSEEGNVIHRTLLAAGVWIIEGLNLSGVRPGKYELVCLPLKIVNIDGAPARAMLKRIGTS